MAGERRGGADAEAGPARVRGWSEQARAHGRSCGNGCGANDCGTRAAQGVAVKDCCANRRRRAQELAAQDDVVRGVGGVSVRAQERDPSGSERPGTSSGAQGGFRHVSSSAMRAEDARGSGVRGWR
jgi:hypothetical protein